MAVKTNLQNNETMSKREKQKFLLPSSNSGPLVFAFTLDDLSGENDEVGKRPNDSRFFGGQC